MTCQHGRIIIGCEQCAHEGQAAEERRLCGIVSNSPIRKKLVRLVMGMGIHRWEVAAPFKSAKFVYPRDRRLFFVVHPSTIEPGRWQVSEFDEDGAIGDTRRDTASDAVDCVPTAYELTEVVQ